MNRDYENDEVRDDVVFFTGIEVEHTPAYGMKTLFVTGLQPSAEIIQMAILEHCDHIYLGANQSFVRSDEWETIGEELLENGFLVTLDFPVADYEWVYEGCMILFENDNFIPQISVKIPYIKQASYNTVVKIDDKDFKASNPGVWCHMLHDLMDREKFTPWAKYTDDKPVE